MAGSSTSRSRSSLRRRRSTCEHAAPGQPADYPDPAAPVSPPDAGPPADTRPVSVLPVLRELSPWSMFQNADVLVKAVMISLAFASLVTWTIFFARSVQLAFGRRRLRKALALIANTPTLAEAQLAAGRRRTLLSAIVGSAFPRCGRRLKVRPNASRRARLRAFRKSSARKLETRAPAWVLSGRSVRRRPSSACSAPCGAS